MPLSLNGNYWYQQTGTAADTIRYWGYSPGQYTLVHNPSRFSRAPIDHQVWSYNDVGVGRLYTFTFDKNFFKKHILSLPKDTNLSKLGRTEAAAILIYYAEVLAQNPPGGNPDRNTAFYDARFNDLFIERTENNRQAIQAAISAVHDILNATAPNLHPPLEARHLNLAQAKLLQHKIDRMVQERAAQDNCQRGGCGHRIQRHGMGGSHCTQCACPHYLNAYITARDGKESSAWSYPLSGARTRVNGYLVMNFFDTHRFLNDVVRGLTAADEALLVGGAATVGDICAQLNGWGDAQKQHAITQARLGNHAPYQFNNNFHAIQYHSAWNIDPFVNAHGHDVLRAFKQSQAQVITEFINAGHINNVQRGPNNQYAISLNPNKLVDLTASQAPHANANCLLKYTLSNDAAYNGLGDTADGRIDALIAHYLYAQEPLPRVHFVDYTLQLRNLLRFPNGVFEYNNLFTCTADLSPGNPDGKENHYKIVHFG